MGNRKKRVRNPYDERERMDIILSTLNTGLVLLDPDMTVVWANAMIWKMFPDENLYGKKCYAVAESRNTPCKDCQAVHSFKDGKVHQREFQNKFNKRWYQVIALPVKDENGRVINVLEATTDIDNQKQVEKSLAQALKQLKVLKKNLEEENIYLKSEINEARLISGMVGTSNALHYVHTRIKRVAPTDATVLIQGETGVGKELVARAIHDHSKRSAKPFIKINCAAIPSNLVESELFGHERGAFTDAHHQRKGRFELANTGTLFLDEISELPQDTQAKLLRVLQDGEFERLGGNRTFKSDVRIIAATNKDLNVEVAEGRFRADLFYRLNVFPISVPPLRKRREDIPQLAEHFISVLAPAIGKKIDRIPRQTLDLMNSYGWPGNIRELRNVIERSIITSSNASLQMTDDLLSINTPPAEFSEGDANASLDQVQRQHILAILKKTDWKIEGPKGAAKILQLKPSTLRHRIKKLGIKR